MNKLTLSVLVSFIYEPIRCLSKKTTKIMEQRMKL